MTDENQEAPTLVADDEIVRDDAQIPAEPEAGEEQTEQVAETPVVEDDPAPDEETQKKADEDARTKKRERQKRSRELKRERAETLERIRKAGAGDTPKESDFEDYSDYIAAKAVYAHTSASHQQKLSEAEEATKAAEDQDKAAQVAEFKEQAAIVAKEIPDFADVVNSAPVSDAVVDIVYGSEASARIAYHLGKNHSLAREISEMSPLDAARTIGRIEAQITSPPPRRSTKAPPPPSPVSGGGGNVQGPPSDPAEYRKWRERQDA